MSLEDMTLKEVIKYKYCIIDDPKYASMTLKPKEYHQTIKRLNNRIKELASVNVIQCEQVNKS